MGSSPFTRTKKPSHIGRAILLSMGRGLFFAVAHIEVRAVQAAGAGTDLNHELDLVQLSKGKGIRKMVSHSYGMANYLQFWNL